MSLFSQGIGGILIMKLPFGQKPNLCLIFVGPAARSQGSLHLA